MKTKNKIFIYPYDLILLYFSILGLINVLALALKVFYPRHILLLTTIIVFVLTFTFNKMGKITLSHELKFNKYTFLILLIALALRLPPNLYLMGGQDEGTYVSISKQYELGHKLYYTDSFRENLSGPEKEIYDELGNYMMPSFENWNRPDSEYTMRFYPGYPSILSIGSVIFGSDHRVLMLTLLSIMSLCNLYLITHYLTGNKLTANLVLLLLAINPVHVFMSKFPVGEVAALTFASGGFYFLIRYLSSRDTKNKQTVIFLISSLLSFALFTLIRMTFLLYLPIIFLIVIFTAKENFEKIILPVYFTLCVAIMHLSYLYYRTFQYPLYLGLYQKTFVSAIDSVIPLEIPLLAKTAILYLILLITILLVFKEYFYKKLINHLRMFFLVTAAVFTFIIYNATSKDLHLILNSSTVKYERWNLIHRGYDAIKHVPLVSVTNYLSLAGFILLIGYLVWTIIKVRELKYYLISFVSIYFLSIYIFRLGLMRYDYYNSRYYLTEVIPTAVLPIGIALTYLINLAKKFLRITGFTLLILILIYFSIFSFFQIGKIEGPDNNFYQTINSRLTNNDLLIVINSDIYNDKHSHNFNSYVVGPIKYYFNKHVLLLDSPEMINDYVVKGIMQKAQNVYYLSNVPLNIGSQDESVFNFNYYYFNNAPGCNYHSYEFLKKEVIDIIPLPNDLKCKFLPNAFFKAYREYYFGNLNNLK